jgi:hypothetical protein
LKQKSIAQAAQAGLKFGAVRPGPWGRATFFAWLPHLASSASFGFRPKPAAGELTAHKRSNKI